MSHALLQESTFHALLNKIDQDAARQLRVTPCEHCGAVRHWANYGRKVRGLGEGHAEADWGLRYSLCCGAEGCRKRATPPSIRFAGRRVYAALAVVLASAAATGGRRVDAPARAAVMAAVGASMRTVRRWVAWWRGAFLQSPVWAVGRARFMPPVDEAQLPGALLTRFGGEAAEAMGSVLAFIAPLSVLPRRVR